MPILKGKPNPLDFFKCRKYTYPAKHLQYIEITRLTYNLESALDTWIKNNLTGRYYIKKELAIGEEIGSILKIGFENPAEASYFQLACPLLKY